VSSFRNEYPDFASIEHHIRQAHAERTVAIATAVANGIFAAAHGIGRLFAKAPAAKASVPNRTANA
jgi:hypothetical protein